MQNFYCAQRRRPDTEPEALPAVPIVGQPKAADPKRSVLDATLEICFDSPITRETGVTRSQAIEHVQMWMWSRQIMEAERGFDEYVRTGRLVEVGRNAHRKPLYKLSEHLG